MGMGIETIVYNLIKVILTSLLYEHGLVDVVVLVNGTTCEHSKLLLVVR